MRAGGDGGANSGGVAGGLREQSHSGVAERLCTGAIQSRVQAPVERSDARCTASPRLVRFYPSLHLAAN